jgi:lipopolysaccharide export system permease protein
MPTVSFCASIPILVSLLGQFFMIGRKVDKLVVDAFIGLFFLTFSVVLFILLMVFMAKFIEDLMGKDLGYDVVGKIFFYFSMTLVPQALPLAMLLSSLMAFGNLGEHNELTAIKGIGIPLTRTLMPIGTFAVLLTVVAYLFNNYIVPEVNLQAYRLLYDARQKEPTLDFPEGAFHNGIPNWSIYIGKKHPDGERIEDIYIYDHTRNMGNTDLISARRGVMRTIGNNQYLYLEVEDGYRFSQQYVQDGSGRKSLVRDRFETATFTFDLAFMQMDETPEELFRTNRYMMNISQLQAEADSLYAQADTLAQEFSNRSHSYFDYIFKEFKEEPQDQQKASNLSGDYIQDSATVQMQTSSATIDPIPLKKDDKKKKLSKEERKKQKLNQTTQLSTVIIADSTTKKPNNNTQKIDSKPQQQQANTLLEQLGNEVDKRKLQSRLPDNKWLAPDEIEAGYTPNSIAWSEFEQKNMVERARDRANNIRTFATSQYERINSLNRNARRALIEKNKRYTYAISCFAMFLIGAPLGAIIKKGGLGMPVLVSIGFFMLFYVLSITGDKWAREQVVSIWLGSWVANIVLFTIGLFFLQQARKDSRLFETDSYLVLWDKLKKRLGKGNASPKVS